MLKFCSLASGSGGNSQYIYTNGTGLLLDAGLSGKYIETAMRQVELDIQKVDGLLVTHEHSDHIKGIGVLMRRYGFPLYVTEKTWTAMREKIGKVNTDHVIMISPDRDTQIGEIKVSPYRISHDAVEPVAYTFQSAGKKLAIATDLGTFDQEIVDRLADADFLMIESNHDVEMLKVGPYPYYLKKRILSQVGHLSNEAAGELAYAVHRMGKTRSFLLAHLSKDNNFPELAHETVKGILEAEGLAVGQDYTLHMSYRDRASQIFTL